MALLVLHDKKTPIRQLLNRRRLEDARQGLEGWALFVGHLSIVHPGRSEVHRSTLSALSGSPFDSSAYLAALCSQGASTRLSSFAATSRHANNWRTGDRPNQRSSVRQRTDKVCVMADDDAWSLTSTIARKRLMEVHMNAMHAARTATAIVGLAMLGGCASWYSLDKTEGTAAGAVGGAVAGAVVAGPIGAVVGGVGGAYVGNETTGNTGTVTTNTRSMTPQSYDASTIRAVQHALNARGYDPGPVDGQYGASTKDAVMRFQQFAGLPVTGELGRPTLDALGVS